MVEHAAELQVFDQRAQLGCFCLHGDQAGLVAVFLAHFVELGVVGQLLGELVEREHHRVQRLLLFAQLLGFFRIVPDRRVFERCVDRAQAFKFGIEVKDTSVTLACAESGLRGWCR